MVEMSNGNSIGLVQALEAAEVPPTDKSEYVQATESPTIAKTIPENAIMLTCIPTPGVALGSPSTNSPKPIPGSTPVRKVQTNLTCMPLTRKPLRGNAGGVLLATTPASGGVYRIVTPNNQLLMNGTSFNIIQPAGPTNIFPVVSNGQTVLYQAATPVCTVATSSLQRPALKAPECQSKLLDSTSIVCNACGTLTVRAELCSKCNQPLRQNPKVYDDIVNGCTVGASGDKSRATLVVTKKSFYGNKSTVVLTPGPAATVNGNVIKKNLRRAPKRKPGPPVCLTISDDEESMDTASDSMQSEVNGTFQQQPAEEEESHPTMADGESKSCELDGLATGKVGKASWKDDPVLYTKMMSNKVKLACRSIKVGSYKVTPEQPVFFLDGVLSMTIPSVSDPTSMEEITMEEITIGVEDVVMCACHFGRALPMIIFYTTVGFAASVRQKLKMIKKEGPYFDPQNSAAEVHKRMIFLPESFSDEQKSIMKAIYDVPISTIEPLEGPEGGEQNSKLAEIDQKVANAILLKSTSGQIIKNMNKLISGSRLGSPTIPLTSPVSRSPVIIPLNTIKPLEVTKMITYPPPPQTGGITVNSDDFNCLDPGEFLNDVIIDFYLKYVIQEKLTQEQRDKTHIFSSFFYGRLNNADMPSSPSSENPKGSMPPIGERRHSRVKTWTRHVDIFSKDYIIIPINENSHWFLAIICHPAVEDLRGVAPTKKLSATGSEVANASKKDSNAENKNEAEKKVPIVSDVKKRKAADNSKRPLIMIFDSLLGRNWSKITAVLREYLTVEWRVKKGTERSFTRYNIKGVCPPVPQQSNFSDCGPYLLQFVDTFFENPIKDFSLPIRGLQTWFSDEVVGNKRQYLKDLILKLQREQNQSALDAKSGESNTIAPATANDSGSINSSLESCPLKNCDVPNATTTTTTGEPANPPTDSCLKKLAADYASDRSSPGLQEDIADNADNGCGGSGDGNGLAEMTPVASDEATYGSSEQMSIGEWSDSGCVGSATSDDICPADSAMAEV